jgi:acetyl-CoA carboxylase biotin carboxyl carrier protein
VSLTAADVAEIMRLVEQSSFDELLLEVDGMKLCLRRGAGISAAPMEQGSASSRSHGASLVAPNSAGAASATSVAAHAPAADAAVRSAARAAGSAAPLPSSATAASTDPNVQDVVAPLLGTFYRAPKPGAQPFVEVGSVVEEDTVIAIIEVMKLMNSVRAGVRGTVTEILVSDGSLVEYEQVLLRVRKEG